MTKYSQKHRSTTLPFEYRDSGLNFELQGYSVDGKKPVDLDLKPGQSEIDLSSILTPSDENSDGDWQKVALYGRLTVPEETVCQVFPREERERPPAKLYVAIRCHDTIFRDRTIVSEAPTAPDRYDATVVLHSEDLRGTVELHPYLVRTEDGPPGGRYAAQRNFRVAGGGKHIVILDRQEDEEPPAIDGEEVSFSRASHLPDGDKIYYLDFRNESRPKLWINSDHPRITNVLESRGSVGAEPRMRDVILDQISYGVWSQLLIRAASAIDDDGDVEYEWQQTILETFALELYEVDDLEGAKRRLSEDVDDPASLGILMERINCELQEYIDPRTQLINLMEEGVRI